MLNILLINTKLVDVWHGYIVVAVHSFHKHGTKKESSTDVKAPDMQYARYVSCYLNNIFLEGAMSFYFVEYLKPFQPWSATGGVANA